jgi:hypothetical protein
MIYSCFRKSSIMFEVFHGGEGSDQGILSCDAV